MTKNQHTYLKSLVSENKIFKVFEEMLKLNLDNADETQVYQIKKRYNELQEQIGSNTITQEMVGIEKNKISKSLLDLIDKIYRESKPTIFAFKKWPSWLQIIGLIGSVASIIGLSIAIIQCWNEKPISIKEDIFGCTNKTACNYKPEATKDDGNCKEIPICNSDPCNGDITQIKDNKCICDTIEKQVLGCMDSKATNYDPAANCDNKLCKHEEDILGCTDQTACNYNSKATQDDGSCKPTPTCNSDPCIGDITRLSDNKCECETIEKQIMGCMEEKADNYNSDANCNDTSCYVIMAGKVLDSNSVGISNIEIGIEGKDGYTNEKGKFELTIPFRKVKNRNQVAVEYTVNNQTNKELFGLGQKNIVIRL